MLCILCVMFMVYGLHQPSSGVYLHNTDCIIKPKILLLFNYVDLGYLVKFKTRRGRSRREMVKTFFKEIKCENGFFLEVLGGLITETL